MSLSRALQLWIDVTGVDPNRKAWSIGQFEIQRMHEALREALELDDTEITGRLLFEYLATSYFKDRTFSVEDLIEKPQQVASYLDKSKELLSYLRSDDILSIRNEFVASMKKAAGLYGAVGRKTHDMMEDPHKLAILRRDAMRTMKNLRVDQFLDGEPESQEHAPLYGKHVYRWNNINSMLNCMTKMPSGVTVNLICHPTDPFRSYFAFAIRNGGRLFVFTDKEKTPHPLAEDMWRRMDKVLAERAARNWFPYELMGLSFDEDGKAYIDTSTSNGLVPYQSETHAIKAVADLDAPNFLWIAMMLDLIVKKFWRGEYRAPELSYTGEMVSVKTPLIDAAKKSNLPVAGYTPLVLTPLTMEEVRDGNGEEFGESNQCGKSWLEERYGHLVTEDTIDFVLSPEKIPVLEFKPETEKSIVIVDTKAEKNRSLSLFSSTPENVGERLALDNLDATSFGTKKQIEDDRLFLARSNYAKQIDKLARDEFLLRSKEVTTWVRERILGNVETLFPLMTKEETLLPSNEPGTDNPFEQGAYTWHGKTADGYMRRFSERKSIVGDEASRLDYIYTMYGDGKFVFTGQGERKKGRPPCFVSGAASSWFVRFIPETTADLAFLCGCEIEDLPDVLQHWTLLERKSGNHILRRVDPTEWQIGDPWKNLLFETVFFISASSMKKLESDFGKSEFQLPQQTD